MVESLPSKQMVAGSSPVSRSVKTALRAVFFICTFLLTTLKQGSLHLKIGEKEVGRYKILGVFSAGVYIWMQVIYNGLSMNCA